MERNVLSIAMEYYNIFDSMHMELDFYTERRTRSVENIAEVNNYEHHQSHYERIQKMADMINEDAVFYMMDSEVEGSTIC